MSVCTHPWHQNDLIAHSCLVLHFWCNHYVKKTNYICMQKCKINWHRSFDCDIVFGYYCIVFWCFGIILGSCDIILGLLSIVYGYLLWHHFQVLWHCFQLLYHQFFFFVLWDWLVSGVMALFGCYGIVIGWCGILLDSTVHSVYRWVKFLCMITLIYIKLYKNSLLITHFQNLN